MGRVVPADDLPGSPSGGRVVPNDDLPAAASPTTAKPGFAETARMALRVFAPGLSTIIENPQRARDTVGGSLRGAGSIGSTLVAPYDIAKDAIAGKGLSLESNRERRAGMDGGLRELGADPDSSDYQGSKLLTEIAGAAGAGGGLANLLSKIPGVATKAPAVLDAIRTSGMTAGGMTGAKSLVPRMIGGGGTGGASAALINPEDWASGVGIGAVAPPLFMGAGKVGGAAIQGVRNAFTPQDVRLAQKLAKTADMPVDQLRNILKKQGPQLIEGYQETVPQMLQNPAISQLQRTLKTAGNDALGSAERTQQQQFLKTLNRVAPVNITLQDAAERAGGAIQDFAIPARADATKRVSQAFDAVDPFNESALHLPIEDMQAASAKYLGAGTFGTGGKASEAIATARRVGTEELPALVPTSQAVAGKGQTLEQAVRSAGGLRGNSGELRDLGIRQSGTTGLINNKSGKSADLLAEEMRDRGFLPDNDPATLYEMLRNGAGRKVFSSDFADTSFARQLEQSMGDLPGAETISKAVPFQTVQNLRSSIGEAAEQAAAKGANKEAAALRQMVADIDSRINRAAGGSVGEGEFFPKDMADQYRAALNLHADKMGKFETGPQIGMFRKGGDGQASVQGAEIPGKFYSGRRSQADDVEAFRRLVDGPQGSALMRELQSYATTEGANTANAAGNLTSKYGDWLASRSGANRGLFDPGQNAALKAVDDAVRSGASAENLGRVSGSDTAQKLESLQSLGLLDSRLVNVLANRVPLVGSFTGPFVDGLRNTARSKQSDTLARLLANPQALDGALGKIPQGNSELAKALLQFSQPAYRVAPIIPALTD